MKNLYDWIATAIVVSVGVGFFYIMGWTAGADVARNQLRACQNDVEIAGQTALLSKRNTNVYDESTWQLPQPASGRSQTGAVCMLGGPIAISDYGLDPGQSAF